MLGRIGSKYAWPLYLRSRYSLTTINTLETTGLGKISHIFVSSMIMLQMPPLILENSPFPCIWETKTFSEFFKSFSTTGIGFKSFYYILLDTEFFLQNTNGMFRIMTYFKFFVKWFHWIVQLCSKNMTLFTVK